MSECRSFENSYLTYQKNKDMVLSKANDYYRNNKENKQEINTETCLKNKQIKKRIWKK